jgi:hypothetical protein
MESKEQFKKRVVEEHINREAWNTLLQAVTLKEVREKPETSKYTRKLQEIGIFLNIIR